MKAWLYSICVVLAVCAISGGGIFLAKLAISHGEVGAICYFSGLAFLLIVYVRYAVFGDVK